jgi:hypothetical protein
MGVLADGLPDGRMDLAFVLLYSWPTARLHDRRRTGSGLRMLVIIEVVVLLLRLLLLLSLKWFWKQLVS